MDSYYPTEEDPAMQESDMEGTPESKSDYDTFLVPKSALHEPEPGKREEVEVVHVYEDEVEVRCVGAKKEPRKSAMDEADESLTELAK